MKHLSAKILSVLMAFTVLIGTSLVSAGALSFPNDVKTMSKSILLVSMDTGQTVFEKDADAVRYPASMTKILTVLLGIMYVEDPDQIVTVSETALNVPEDSSTMHLKAG